MQQTASPTEILESALSETSDVYVNSGVDEASYFEGLRSDIRSHLCEPFEVSATVQEPGFPDIPVGSTINGLCLAHSAGYWLVYHREHDRFYCFWGVDTAHLGAHGVFGSPLCCWSS